MKYSSIKEWQARGLALFGPDTEQWKFKCPACNTVRMVIEYKEYADRGAKPTDAYQQCLGRFTGGRKGPHKCDWAAFGLLKLRDSSVMDGEKEIHVFEFAENEP